MIESTIDLIAIPPADDVIDRLRAFEIACGRRKRGLRLETRVDRVLISIDPSQIERFVPSSKRPPP
jgi:hypothetical protein